MVALLSPHWLRWRSDFADTRGCHELPSAVGAALARTIVALGRWAVIVAADMIGDSKLCLFIR
jgi:hypothetical protein